MRFTRFKAQYLLEFQERDDVQVLHEFIRAEHVEELEQSPWSVLGLAGNLCAPVFAAGISQVWPGRGIAWSIWSAEINPGQVVRAVREIRRQLDVCPLRRIESVVQIDNEDAHKLNRLLGFKVETPLMPAYFPTGEAGTLYVRLK